MPIALVASVSAASSNGTDVTTAAIDTTGANLLVVGIAGGPDTAHPLSDSKGNTWTALTAQNATGGQRFQLYYAGGTPTVGTGHTFASGFGWVPTLFAFAFSGAHATPFDQESGANGFGATLQPGSLTPSVDGCLVVQGLAFNTAGLMSINESYTGLVQHDRTGGNMGGAAAYKIQTTAAATNPTWTHDSTSSMCLRAAVFKPAGAGGSALPVIVHHYREMGFM